MKSSLRSASPTLLSPPAAPQGSQVRNWFSLPDTDPVVDHIKTVMWDQENAPTRWRTARLSPAAYVYWEQETGWKVVAKFYISKTGDAASHHAEREYQRTRQAWEYLGAEQAGRPVKPLGLWEGALFLEFVPGLTLEDQIAIRRSQPGKLAHILATVGRFLATLHANSVQPDATPDFGQAADYAHRLVDNLVKHGVLRGHPGVQSGLELLIEKWASDPLVWEHPQARSHGDATTTNFIFPPQGGVVAIDWERSQAADPAADVGRLMAEVTHSVNRHGGNFAEGDAFAEHLASVYCANLPSDWDAERLMCRARFYQATSTLRIARNGWLAHLDRLALVLQAFALLAK